MEMESYFETLKTPRKVPLLTRLALVFSQAGSATAWITLCIGVAICGVAVRYSDLTSIRLYRGSPQRAHAFVQESVPTHWPASGGRLYAHRYAFHVGQKVYLGVSYSSEDSRDLMYRSKQAHYLPDNPSISCLQGMRGAPIPFWGLGVGLIALLPGISLVLRQLRGGLGVVDLLMNGLAVNGTIAVPPQPVPEPAAGDEAPLDAEVEEFDEAPLTPGFTIDYQTLDGTAMSVPVMPPAGFAVKPGDSKVVLYARSRPVVCIVPQFLPGRPACDQWGQVTLDSHSAAARALFVPAALALVFWASASLWTPTEDSGFDPQPPGSAAPAQPGPTLSGYAPTQTPDRRSPLRKAVDRWDLADVKRLVAGGARLDEVDETGRTLLHAAASGKREIAEFLIAHGLKTDARDKYGKTPLMTAAYCGKADVAALLLRNGADPNAISERGDTPLGKAAIMGHTDIVRMLIKAGSRVNFAEPGSGYTPLHYAAGWGRAGTAGFLLEKGAQIDLKERTGSTPLLLALNSGHADASKLLIRKGANLNIASRFGETPLSSTVRRKDRELIRLLITRGANIEQRGDEGRTPLCCAVSNGDSDTVELLLAKGADPNRSNNFGDTPLHMAVCRGDGGVLQMLIDARADVNARNHHGQTPLHYAVERQKRGTIDILLAAGADINAEDGGHRTPLAEALSRGNQSLAEFLLSKGARSQRSGR